MLYPLRGHPLLLSTTQCNVLLLSSNKSPFCRRDIRDISMDRLGNASWTHHREGQAMGKGSSSLERSTPGAAGFLTLIQVLDRPDLYGWSRCLETMPSRPSLQASRPWLSSRRRFRNRSRDRDAGINRNSPPHRRCQRNQPPVPRDQAAMPQSITLATHTTPAESKRTR